MKNILTLIVILATVGSGYSQKFHYGFGAGVNYTSLVFNRSDFESPKYKVGFQINAVVGYSFGEKIGIRLEPGFAKRGTVLSYPGFPDSNINLDYITLPLLLQYSPVRNFSILLGPECSYRITANAITNGSSTDLTSIYDSKFDVGINAEIAYKVYNKLELGLRYNRGFISTIKDLKYTDGYGNDMGKATACNQGVTLALTYMIK
ncbi:MAG TPA: porin family protein [Williamwhitmania sp.]|nr:porin family protein [Williamwhitmania sp.]